MTSPPTYTERERVGACAWKHSTGTLPDAAMESAQYVGKDGVATGKALDFCVPAEYSATSLLPEVRDMALALFAELGIPWHAGVGGRPRKTVQV